MKKVKELKISIRLDDKKLKVGELISDDRKIYFKYDADFIKTGIQISPFKMPLSSQILSADTNIFDGLFGVFNDSLPDGWGRLLLDRTLMEKGVSLNAITPLDRLALVGKDGIGALIYEPINHSWHFYNKPIELDAIQQASKNILDGLSTDIIEELVQLGGSSSGARPKILVGYHKETNHLIYRKHIVPKGYEHWIIKFPSSTDFKDSAQIEYAYHKMAIDAGLDMNECHLFEGASGQQYFGTKRFDRIENQRIHMHSAAGLLHDNFRLSNMDYGHIMDAAFRLENHTDAYKKVLRIAAFNVFTHNRDDHSKNFSFLMNGKGEWKLAPVYDLTFSFSSHGFHSTTIAGEGRSPGVQNLLELAHVFDIKNANEIIKQVKDVVNNWTQYAQICGVSRPSLKLISKTIGKID